MELKIKKTEQIIEIDGVQCRKWTGIDENGIKVNLFVHRICIDKNNSEEDIQRFQNNLLQQNEPINLKSK